MKNRVMSVIGLACVALLAVGPALAQSAYTRVYARENFPVPSTARSAAPARVMLANNPPASDVQSIQTILSRLKSANNVPADISPTIKVETSSSLNAATNGQDLMITSALLEKLTTSDERAFVISHELSHILLQHIGKTQARRIGLSLIDQFFVRRYTAEGSLAQLASELGIGLVDKRSSRGFEYQADDLGVKLMRQAGYDPRAALKVFDILQAATPGNQVPEFLQDHPITQSRIKVLVEKYKLSLQ